MSSKSLKDLANETLPGAGEVMQGTPPPVDKRVTLENWDTPPFISWSFQNMAQIFPVVSVSRGKGPVARLDQNLQDLTGISVTRLDNSQTTVGGVLADTNTDGFLVLHKGEIITEEYFGGMTADTLHLAQSVSKSIVGTLAGIFLNSGLLDLGARVQTYVPELANSGYANATIKNLLNMQTGVQFNEDYTDPDAEFALLDMAAGWKDRITGTEPETIYDLLVSIAEDRRHGEYFQYRSIDTDVLAWVCERVGGARLAELISREIWSKIGAEKDALFTTDKAGTSLADGGFNATLRDFARFGQMHLQMGRFNDQQLASTEWFRSCRSGDSDKFKVLYSEFAEHYPRAAYANQWWVVDSEREMYAARGVFGQLICIDPATELVVVKLSSWANFLDFDRNIHTHRMIEAIANYLDAP
ncbi:MAG: serine hydrolase [Alphaproteobacteria bacterium]|jgi:CubicO group peptidase (beta-lactamase class C family)|nr:serine hydrolase [Alphaproteobacteria bacterium]MBT4019224.1 serine hydrolase [Alphaproteobacteria bacterium]MBT5160836.1 serine hydrolase [Alphaproteobacteria bacterium]MBT5917553.1 serine hydrolase [Alphaproteobacteria bacterium]MBT6385501.1 serine hydrolase [Alphaproteobacteria bacterium]